MKITITIPSPASIKARLTRNAQEFKTACSESYHEQYARAAVKTIVKQLQKETVRNALLEKGKPRQPSWADRTHP